MEVPNSLRAWFVLHALVAVMLGIPMLLVPEGVLPRLGWTAVDPVTARLLGAAYLAMGAQSWRMRAAGVAEYRAMLGLLVIWSTAAILGLTIAIARGAPPLAFSLLAGALLFCGVWSHYAIRLRQLANAPADPPPSQTDGEDGNDGELSSLGR